MLERITKGKVQKPHLLLIFGTDGVGKSSFSAQAPEPIFLGSEDGTNNLDVSRFPKITSWSEVQTALSDLETKEHNFKTLVIDSLDWLEPILHRTICEQYGAKSIELAAGGYGKGYIIAANEWGSFITSLSRLRDKGMNIIIIAHSEIVKYSDPTFQSEYDRIQLKVHKKASAMFREFVDTVLFASFEVFTKKDGLKTKAIGDGARVMYTERRPGFDAKNRFDLPFKMALSWTEYDAAVQKPASKSLDELHAELKELVAQIGDDVLRKVVVESVTKAGEDLVKLTAIKNRVKVRLGE